MAKQDNTELGFDSQGRKGRQRNLNPDGTFNITRINAPKYDLYRWFITTSWPNYWKVVMGFYILLNFIFGFIYFIADPTGLAGINTTDPFMRYWWCFFFSVQTFTTVGYGGMHPTSVLVSTIAGFEAFLALMTFAVATGTLYARFSRPVAKLKFGKNAIIAPFQDGKALMFMLVNNRKNHLVEVQAEVNYSRNVEENGNTVRKLSRLELQVERVAMLPMNWTIVHKITKDSPFYGKKMEDLLHEEGEVFILIKAHDDTYSETVHSRSSYITEEIVWGARFKRPFYSDENGKTILDMAMIGVYEPAELVENEKLKIENEQKTNL